MGMKKDEKPSAREPQRPPLVLRSEACPPPADELHRVASDGKDSPAPNPAPAPAAAAGSDSHSIKTTMYERCAHCGFAPLAPHQLERSIAQSAESSKAWAAAFPLTRCANGHWACPDCQLLCRRCGKLICLKCEHETCGNCGIRGCLTCFTTCELCHRRVCKEHLKKCEECGMSVCEHCLLVCMDCGKKLCRPDAVPTKFGDAQVCQYCIEHCALCPPETSHRRIALDRCGECEAYVCDKHRYRSEISNRLICENCRRQCDRCKRWAGALEFVRCAACGTSICMACAVRCSLCNEPLCQAHSLECSVCGKVGCAKCNFECPVCKAHFCKRKSHGDKCSACGVCYCSKCLLRCEDCANPLCPTDLFTCPVCDKDVCQQCMVTCPYCGKRIHKPHMGKCSICAGPVCPKCLKTCNRCGAETDPVHAAEYSENKRLCLPCVRRKERIVAAIAIPCVVAAIIGLGFLMWTLMK